MRVPEEQALAHQTEDSGIQQGHIVNYALPDDVVCHCLHTPENIVRLCAVGWHTEWWGLKKSVI